MHILIVPSWYRTKEDPGLGSFFTEQASALARRGHRVSVFAYYGDAEKNNRVEKVVSGGMTEYFIHVKRLRFHLTYFSVVFSMLRLLRRELRGDKPDMIHVHSFSAVKYARFLSAWLHIPLIVTEHLSAFARKTLSETQYREARRAFHAADRVLVVSEGLKESISPYCDREITVLPNMVHERFFSAPLHESSREVFSLISVGSLDENKGMDAVVSAFARASREDPRLHLTVCGSGPERERLESMAAASGVSERVLFTGQLDREEVAERLRQSQAFVLASRVETFGIVLIEAMAMGLPILMTKTGAWRALIREETGLAAEIGGEDALAEGMLRLAAKEKSYDPAAIRAFCREHFSEESVCVRLEAIYKELTEKK